jgi:hypothetical protein
MLITFIMLQFSTKKRESNKKFSKAWTDMSRKGATSHTPSKSSVRSTLLKKLLKTSL